MEEKSRALTLLEKSNSVITKCERHWFLEGGYLSVEEVCKVTVALDGTKKKSDSGVPRITSSRTYKLLKREVLSYPSVTAFELKSKNSELLQNVSTRTIRHQLQKNLGLPCRRAAKKPYGNKEKKTQFFKEILTLDVCRMEGR